jgi:hypothetical protein
MRSELWPMISNHSLKESDIPLPDAAIESIAAFALTFNGYEHSGSLQDCANIANARRHDTLTNLRTCLFFEQRRWRHFNEPPDAAAQAYWRNLVLMIREKVQAGELA